MMDACDAIVAVPPIVSRRAWEAAVDLTGDHGFAAFSPTLLGWVQIVVAGRNPLRLTWAETGTLFRLHRRFRGVRV